MTLEKLEARQQNEIKEYMQDRDERLIDLENDQQKLIDYYNVDNSSSHDLFHKVLQSQRDAWLEMERNELDLLKHIHILERESFLDKEAKRKELAALLSKGKDSAKDNGR